MPDIEKIIEATKRSLEQILDEAVHLPEVENMQGTNLDFKQSIAWASQYLGVEKEPFKVKIREALNDLKIDLVRGIVERDALAKNKYEVVFLKVRSELIPVKPEQVLEGPQFGRMREVIDLQEGDIPISYQSYVSMFSCGSSSGPGAGGQQLVREVVVLRPVAVDEKDVR